MNIMSVMLTLVSCVIELMVNEIHDKFDVFGDCFGNVHLFEGLFHHSVTCWPS